MFHVRSAILICVLLTIALVASSSGVHSSPQEAPPAYQSLPWVYTGGPIGGLGYDVRMDPNNPDIMFVTDAWAGVFKSTDGGDSWFPSNTGIVNRVGPSGDGIPVFSLTIDPNDSDRVWAGTQYSSGVYRSDDGGNTWTLMNNGLVEVSLSVRGFTVEPGNSNVVYMAGEVSSWEWSPPNPDPLPSLGMDLTMGAVYKTVDGGQNWTRIWYGDNLARYIWIHPQNHNRLYVSTGIFDREAANSDPAAYTPGGVGVLRSDDGGQTWEVLNEANGFDANELYIGSLYMHPTNPNILLAAAGNDPYTPFVGAGPLGGVYRTTDGGDTWTQVLDGANFSMVEICENNPNIAYAGSEAGFFRSEDGGVTWQQLGGYYWGPEDVVAGFPIDVQCDPRNVNRIFANNYGGGNFLSEDGGQTWTVSSAGYTGALLNQIGVAQDDAGRVYTVGRSGIFGSRNGGDTWYGLGYGLARSLDIISLGVDPGNASHILAVAVDLGGDILISRSSGQTWSKVTPGLWPAGEAASRIVFAPSNPQQVYATIGPHDCIYSVRVDHCTDPNARGVVVSNDGGDSWVQSGLSSGVVMTLAVSPQNANRAYASVYGGGLYRTDNGGQTWDEVTLDPTPPAITPTLTALAIIPGNPDILYAGYYNGGVGISEDGGVTWASASAGMPPEADVFSIVVDPTNTSVLYAGSADSGVYYTVNGGDTWAVINDGLLTRAVKDLAISADGSVLYMNSEGAGVFRLGTPPATQQKLFIPLVLH